MLKICRNTKGPIASIFYQGLDRSNEGLEQVEKSIVAYGSVQMGLLEKGLSWISLFIVSSTYVRIYGYSNWYDWCLILLNCQRYFSLTSSRRY